MCFSWSEGARSRAPVVTEGNVAGRRPRCQRAQSKLVVIRHNARMAPDSGLVALVGRIDRDKLGEIMLATFQDEIPGYARLPDSVVRGEILQVIGENVDLCL